MAHHSPLHKKRAPLRLRNHTEREQVVDEKGDVRVDRAQDTVDHKVRHGESQENALVLRDGQYRGYGEKGGPDRVHLRGHDGASLERGRAGGEGRRHEVEEAPGDGEEAGVQVRHA